MDMKIKSSHPLRVITCCYCGARSTLPPKQATRLVCHGCGAAISRIEELHPGLERQKKSHSHAKPAAPHAAERPGAHAEKDRPARRKKGKHKKRQKSIWHRLTDAVDDFDDIFDLFD